MWAATGMWQEEEGMVIVDAGLSVFMYLMSIFFLTFQFLSDKGTCNKKCLNVGGKNSFN